jgi:hypothetical protein
VCLLRLQVIDLIEVGGITLLSQWILLATSSLLPLSMGSAATLVFLATLLVAVPIHVCNDLKLDLFLAVAKIAFCCSIW